MLAAPGEYSAPETIGKPHFIFSNTCGFLQYIANIDCDVRVAFVSVPDCENNPILNNLSWGSMRFMAQKLCIGPALTIGDYIATDAFRMAQNPPITTDEELELLLTKLACKYNGNILRFIPTYQTPEMVFCAVMVHGACLEHVREDLKTERLCKISVNDSPSNLRFVPEQFRR